MHILPYAMVAASSPINAVTLGVVISLLIVSREVALSSSWFCFGKFFPLLHDCSLLAILDEFGFICANSPGICFLSCLSLTRVEMVVSSWELGILCPQERLPPLCLPALGPLSAHLAGQAEVADSSAAVSCLLTTPLPPPAVRDLLLHSVFQSSWRTWLCKYLSPFSLLPEV